MVRRIDVEPNNVVQLGREVRVFGKFELAYPVRAQAMGAPAPLHRADADAEASAIAAPVQWVAAAGGPPKVSATTLSAIFGSRGGIRDGRVLSRHSPATLSAPNRSCQRHITVLALPVWRMISAVP